MLGFLEMGQGLGFRVNGLPLEVDTIGVPENVFFVKWLEFTTRRGIRVL